MIGVNFQTIPLELLRPSPYNYRKNFKADEMAELTASVRDKGILQPVLVRPITFLPSPPAGEGHGGAEGGGEYEIVAGHRRHRAAEAAGLSELPCLVRTLTDEEAFDCQLIENSQRSDPNPMEEARGFADRMRMGRGCTAEELAAKINHDVRYVRKRIRLLDIIPDAQKKVEDGSLPMALALCLSRLKGNEDAQEDLLERMCYGPDDDPYDRITTVREALEYINSVYSYLLVDAPFDVEGCRACPQRSANQAELFPEIAKDDTCTDKRCYHAKEAEAYRSRMAAAEALGLRIIGSPEEYKKLMDGTKAREIWDPQQERKPHNALTPKRYKSQCMTGCTDHAFYLDVSDPDEHPELLELCLNRACLEEMQRGKKERLPQPEAGNEHDETPAYENPSESHVDMVRRLKEKARDFRDRWLLANMQRRISENETLMNRLILFLVLQSRQADYNRNIELYDHLREMAGIKEKRSYYFEPDIYELVSRIPKGLVPGTTLRAVEYAINRIQTDALIQTVQEARVNIKEEIPLDEEYLKSLKASDMPDLIAKFGLPIEPKPSWTKARLISEILKHDLRGLKTPELLEAFTPKGVGEDEEEGPILNPVDMDVVTNPDGGLCPSCTHRPFDCTNCGESRGDILVQLGSITNCQGFLSEVDGEDGTSTCPECGHNQADKGRHCMCEECGFHPMPTAVENAKDADHPNLNPAPDTFVELCIYCNHFPQDSDACAEAEEKKGGREVERTQGLVSSCSCYKKAPEKKKRGGKKKEEVTA